MDDLEKKAQDELTAIYGGTNPLNNDSNLNPDTPPEQKGDDEEGKDKEIDPNKGKEEEEGEGKDKSKSKAEENFKKILAEKNKEKELNKDLSTRLSGLENELADTKFLKSYPQAEDFMEDIKKEMDLTPGLSREKAFLIVAGDKGINNRPRGIVGNPKAPVTSKPIADMTADEIFEHAKTTNALGKALSGE